MIGDFEAVEYINPCFPDRQMYKCRISSEEYHTDDYGKLIDWAIETIAFLPNKEERQAISDKAIVSFFEGTTTSKD